MEINEIYNLAKQYADMIGKDKPDFVSDTESSICVIVDNDDQPTTGITSVTVKGGQIELLPAEMVAVRRFIDFGSEKRAALMVTMKFKDAEVVETRKASLAMLGQASSANGGCLVLTSAEEGTLLKDIVPVPEEEPVAAEPVAEETAAENADTTVTETPVVEEPSMEDLMNGFDVDTSDDTANTTADTTTEKVGEPAEFADGFSVDKTNPFFEETTTAPDSEVKTIDSGVKSMFEHPEEATNQGAAGFNIPQGGFPQQGMGFPQQGMPQGGFPQQGMQQSGYPQQGMGYPQQGMGYPQQGRQSGYPQQGMGYPQQGRQSGYPQQGMGYPQQGGFPQQGMGYPQQGIQQGGYPQQGAYPQQGMGYPQQGMGMQQQVQQGYPTATPYQQRGNGVQSMQMPGVGQTSVQKNTSLPTVSKNVTSTNTSSLGLKSFNMDDINAKVKAITNPAIDDDDDEDDDDSPMTREEMLKAAKQKKKNAKMNSNFKKKQRDMGF